MIFFFFTFKLNCSLVHDEGMGREKEGKRGENTHPSSFRHPFCYLPHSIPHSPLPFSFPPSPPPSVALKQGEERGDRRGKVTLFSPYHIICLS